MMKFRAIVKENIISFQNRHFVIFLYRFQLTKYFTTKQVLFGIKT